MKNFIITTIIALLTAGWSIAGAKDYPEEYLGLPGDNLNLYAVMKLFQESETLEAFERGLNDENSMINNLDLNGDNLVDYIMVFDYPEGDFHTIVLRVALDERETQDVAVFTVQQYNDGTVGIQLIGDEALYGKNYIIEPFYAEANETPNPGYIGNATPNRKVAVVRTTTYEVATWPIIVYISRPAYIGWRSSWYWGYYPSYWNPWRPFYWHTYYGYHYHWHPHYYAHYRVWNHYRYPRYKNVYYTRIRTYSPRVTVNINTGVYKTTYSRPDLRRQGEVLYARNNSGRSSGTVRNSTDSRVRTSTSTSVQRSRGNVNSGVERQSVSNSGRRTSTQPAVNQRTDVTRKSATVTNNRNNTGSAVRQNAGTRNSSVNQSRGTNGTGSTRNNTGSAVRQGTNNTGRSSSVSATDRNLKSSTINQNSGTNRSSSSNVSRNTNSTRSVGKNSGSTVRSGTSTTQKSANVSNSRSESRPSVNSNSRTSQSSKPAVTGKSNTRSQAAPKVSSSRSSSGQNRQAVSRGSSNQSSRATAPGSSSSRNSSQKSSGRR